MSPSRILGIRSLSARCTAPFMRSRSSPADGLVHWESQSATRADGETGRRYQNHLSMGVEIMLFARLQQQDRAFWFLGPAMFVRHTGERPMAIEWKLRVPMPGDLFARFKAVA